MADMGDDLTPIVVTGARGYLGGAISRRLADASRSWIGLSRMGDMNVIACDMTDAASVRIHIKPGSTVIHCAAVVPDSDAAYGDSDAAARSCAMIDALIAARPAYIVFPSSMTVYAPNGGKPVAEDDISATATGYAAGKIEAERRLADSGVATTIVRLPGLFGPPRRNGLLYNAALAFAKGELPRLPADPPLWAALHIDDAAAYCLRAVDARKEGVRILNVGYPDTFSIDRAVRDLAAMFGRPAPIQKPGPTFAMCLDKLAAELGLEPATWRQRLDGFAKWAAVATPC